MCKVKDLQAFGNSILEIMVGKCEEQLKVATPAQGESTFQDLTLGKK